MAKVSLVYWPRLPLARKAITEKLAAEPGVRLTISENLNEVIAALPGAAGLILSDADKIQARRVLEAIAATRDSFRWIQFITAGRDGFEAAGLPEGVEVTGPGLGVSPVVAEHAMALLLALMRQIPAAAASTAAAEWNRNLMSQMQSLEGRTIAIYGTGRIGREIARRARPFGTELVGISRSGSAVQDFDRVVAAHDASGALSGFDVVIAALPLTDETARMFDEAFFSALKPGAIFVNIARGRLVDQHALIQALESGHLSAAALDVADPEPLPGDDPLWKAPNLLVTAHLSGAGSQPSQARIANEVLGNFRRLSAAGRFAGSSKVAGP
ncbi:NAD(P)-dependent oxidoreductase [Chelativorans sp. Marseille-P2723]|uniref:NAD(P)-dependent oxidoreductase n=1 Tax=Chelativorans sp. Marseille-P2723 TaxID=2709133 RepID=UPI00156E7EC3|nr:NAD(P)-dependent oxidoreductase [Chelativorans sp. Marseille-P2723]